MDTKQFTRSLPYVAVAATFILLVGLLFRERMTGTGVMDDSIGTLIDPTDEELEKCYIPRYMADVKNATVQMARDHWFKGGYKTNNPHCPRITQPGELVPAMTDEEAVRYMQTYQSLNTSTLKNDIAKAKEHWNTTGWKEGRIIPEKPTSFLGKVIALVGGDTKTKYCGVDPANKLRPIDCNRTTIDKQALFETEKISDTEFALKNQGTQQYCSDGGAVGIMCNQDKVGPFETFGYKHMGKKQFLFTGRPSARARCGFNGKVVVCDNKNNGRRGVFQWLEQTAPATSSSATTTTAVTNAASAATTAVTNAASAATTTVTNAATAAATAVTNAVTSAITTEETDLLSTNKMVVTLQGPRKKLQCGVNPTTNMISCDRTTVSDYERFELEKRSEKRYSLKNQGTQKYCKDLGDNIECNVDQFNPGQLAAFEIQRSGKNEIRFVGPKSGTDRLACADTGTGIECKQRRAGPMSSFLWKRADAQTAAKEAAADATFYATAKAAVDEAAAAAKANAAKAAEDAQVIADRAAAEARDASAKAIAYAEAIAKKAAADKELLDATTAAEAKFAADAKAAADKIVADTKAAMEKATLDAQVASDNAAAFAKAAADEAIAVAKAIAEAKAMADAKAEADAKAAALKAAAEAEAIAQANALADAEAKAAAEAQAKALADAQANAIADAQAKAAADAQAREASDAQARAAATGDMEAKAIADAQAKAAADAQAKAAADAQANAVADAQAKAAADAQARAAADAKANAEAANVTSIQPSSNTVPKPTVSPKTMQNTATKTTTSDTETNTGLWIGVGFGVAVLGGAFFVYRRQLKK